MSVPSTPAHTVRPLDPTETNYPGHHDAQALVLPAPDWAALKRRCTYAAIGGLVLLVIGSIIDVNQVLRSYLIGWTLLLGISLGSMVLLMIQHLTGGAWGMLLRRIFEANVRTLPIVAVLFVPIAVAAVLGLLYPWANNDYLSFLSTHAPHEYHAIEGKSHGFLGKPWFLLWSAVCFGIWIFIGRRLNSLSRLQDETGDPALTDRLMRLSGPGIVTYAITVTVGSILWVMSLEPAWYSTMYPVLFAISEFLTAFAFSTLMLIYLSAIGLHPRRPTGKQFRDIASLMLAFVMLWAYMSICQFLLVWAANLREEVPWYLHRNEGSWKYVVWALAFFHFVLPFILLLQRPLKQNPRKLAGIAILLLVIRAVDVTWWVEPSSQVWFPRSMFQSWIFWIFDIAAVVGLGGFWLTRFFDEVRREPLLPTRDPNLSVLEAHSHG